MAPVGVCHHAVDVETSSIVTYLQLPFLSPVGRLDLAGGDPGASRAGVLDDIAQRFLGNAQNDRAGGVVELFRRCLEGDLNRQAGALGDGRRPVAECLFEAFLLAQHADVVRAGSERLLEVFASLPEKEPVAVMYRDDEEIDTFIAFAVMYFAWPRKVQAFPIKGENLTTQMQALADAPVSAAFFCGMEPPSGTEPLFRVAKGLSLSSRTSPQPR